MTEVWWEIVGGADKGGLIVREGSDLKSPQLPDRLSTGARVQELALLGDRLLYRLLASGRGNHNGPPQGWVSISLKGKQLARRIPPDIHPAREPTNTEANSSAQCDDTAKTEKNTFNPYKVLGVAHDATDAQIKSSYRKASLKVHPDHNPDNPNAADEFRNLTKAKDFLLNPLKRFMYNLAHGYQAKRNYVKWWSDWDEILEEIDPTQDEDSQELLAHPAPMVTLGSDSPGSIRTDILILGATGFVGTLICSLMQRGVPGRSWAIAGRSQRKLDLLEAKFGKVKTYRGHYCITGVNDMGTIVKTARVVLDAIGPKWHVKEHGIAAACVRAGTHYVDITGFPGDCLEAKPMLDYIGPRAESAGISLIFFCGIGTIVYDFVVWMCVQHLRDMHNMPTRRIDAYELSPTDSRVRAFLTGGAILTAKGQDNYEKDLRRLGYYFLGGEPCGGIQKEDDDDQFTPVQDEYAGMWKNLDEIVYQLTIRCSYDLFRRRQHQSYGDNFRFRSWNLFPDMAAASNYALRSGNMFVRRGYNKHVELGKIPAQGQGPCERLRKEAIVTRIFVAEGEEGAPGQGPRVHCVISLGPGGLGDFSEGTAATSLEVASCLLDVLDATSDASTGSAGKLAGGFGTPAYHLARFGFQDRLFSMLGLSVKIVEGPPAPQLFQNAMSVAGTIAD